MGAMVEEEEDNWRANEESLEFAVLEAVRDVRRVKEASFCMGEGCKREQIAQDKMYSSCSTTRLMYVERAFLPAPRT